MKTRLLALLFTAGLAFAAVAQNAAPINQTGTGTQIGTQTDQGVSFHGSAPVAQRAGSAQAAVTKTAGAALTGTLTGTANGTLVNVAATAASTAGTVTPSASDVDAGIATAVASIVTGVNEQNKELQTRLNQLVVDNAALVVLVNELRLALVEKGAIKGAP